MTSSHKEQQDLIQTLANKFRKPDTKILAYLNTAAESLFLDSHQAAFENYAQCKAVGSEGRAKLNDIERQTKELVARLIEVNPSDIVFLASTSRCLDAAIKSIIWAPGDNIVFSDTEFLSTEFSGALLGRSGVEVRVVKSKEGLVTPEDFDSHIDARTKLVVTSAVSYKSGLFIDVNRLSEVVHAKGSLLFIDGIQGLGSIQISAKSVDFYTSGTFKWLFGMHGIAIFYVNPNIISDLLIPYVGYHSVSNMFGEDRTETFDLWPDARRFQEGLPNYAGICVLRNSLLEINAVGIANIQSHNSALTRLLLRELNGLGIVPFGSDYPELHAPIVAFETPSFEKIGNSLIDSGVIVWARDGRVRISAHVYNNEEDIGTLIYYLKKLV
jgi:selenocysteine lyase/cysteine desulfurase